MWHKWELLGLQSSLSIQTLCFTSIFESQPCSFILLTVSCYAAVLKYQPHQDLSWLWITKHPYWSFYRKRLSAFPKTKLVFSLSQWSCKFFVIHWKHSSAPQCLRPTSAHRSCKIRHRPYKRALLWADRAWLCAREGWDYGAHPLHSDITFSVASGVFWGRST